MRYKIDEKKLREAVLCMKCFSCLSGGREDLCKIRHCVEGKVHFVECLNDANCTYQKNYGGRIYCDCPVRKELFNTYGI